MTKDKAKKANGLGNIRETATRKFRWEVMVEGRRFSGTVATKRAAQQAISTKIAEGARGGIVDPSSITLGEYLAQWLEGRKASRAVRTHQIQDNHLRNHIGPAIGQKRLQKLTPAEVQHLFTLLNQKGLGAASQRQAHQFLLTALKDALRLELVTRNVAEFVRPIPPIDPDEGELDAYTPEETALFLHAARHDHRGKIFEFFLATGMRRGEVTGLRWTDVNWERRTVSVRDNVVRTSTVGKGITSKPKTSRSRREVHLSKAAQMLLREVQQEQDTARYHMGEKWRESGRVFVDMYGGTLNPNNLKRDMRRIYTAAGVRHLTIHGLRHTYASLSLRRGVPVEVVSKQLGHATVAFTLSLYRTVYTSERTAWALDLDDLILGRKTAAD